MPKITHAHGDSYEGQPREEEETQETVVEEDDKKEGDEVSLGSNSSPSEQNKQKSSEQNKPKFQKPARTTVSRSDKG